MRPQECWHLAGEVCVTNSGQSRGAVVVPVVLLVLFAACGSSGTYFPNWNKSALSAFAADFAACANLPSLIWAIAHLHLRT